MPVATIRGDFSVKAITDPQWEILDIFVGCMMPGCLRTALFTLSTYIHRQKNKSGETVGILLWVSSASSPLTEGFYRILNISLNVLPSWARLPVKQLNGLRLSRSIHVLRLKVLNILKNLDMFPDKSCWCSFFWNVDNKKVHLELL